MIQTDKYLHKSYKFNGRGAEGYDCLGLMLDVLKNNGINLPNDDGREINFSWFQSEPDRFIKGLEKHFNRIKINDRQPLDVVVFLFDGIPRHSGVLVDKYNFIHIIENSTVHISKLSKWNKRIHSIWRAR